MIARLAAAVLCWWGLSAFAPQAQQIDASLPIGARLVVDRETPGAVLRIPVSPVALDVVTAGAQVGGDAGARGGDAGRAAETGGAADTGEAADSQSPPGQDGGPRAPLSAEGLVRHRVWQAASEALTPGQVMAPLRAALLAEGYSAVLDCEARVCGGFAFRFQTDTLPPPEMFVDLGAYRYLAARKGDAEDGAWATLLVSRSDTLVFVQLSTVMPEDVASGGAVPGAGAQTSASGSGAPGQPSAVPRSEGGSPTGVAFGRAQPDGLPADGLQADGLQAGGRALARVLQTDGRVVLDGLAFAPGAGQLSRAAAGDASLAALAAYLDASPTVRIVLVGHTDAEGGLRSNIDLSRRRAEAVRQRLIGQFDVAPGRLRAEGVGYLAPLATNATPEGRDRNRRVEAVVEGTR